MEGVVMLASTNRQDILDQVRTQSRRLKEMLCKTIAISKQKRCSKRWKTCCWQTLETSKRWQVGLNIKRGKTITYFLLASFFLIFFFLIFFYFIH